MKDDKYKIFYISTSEDWVKFSDDFVKKNPEYEYANTIVGPEIGENYTSFANSKESVLTTPRIVRKIVFIKKDKYNDNNK